MDEKIKTLLEWITKNGIKSKIVSANGLILQITFIWKLNIYEVHDFVDELKEKYKKPIPNIKCQACGVSSDEATEEYQIEFNISHLYRTQPDPSFLEGIIKVATGETSILCGRCKEKQP